LGGPFAEVDGESDAVAVIAGYGYCQFSAECRRDWGRLLLRPAEVDFADARNGGDEWGIEFAGEAAHFRESEFECAGHVLTRHVAGGEDELPDGMFREGASFEQVVADTFISRQQNPAL